MNNQLILIKDLGMRYPTSNSKQRTRMGLYKCHCGNEFVTHVSTVKRGLSKSCGCSKITHGLKKHRLYNIWRQMKHRCNNPKNKDYHNYGGRGIKVCEDWLNIENFINDMYPSFEEGLSIDRIDSNGNYCKENCRWATNGVQSRNVRKRKDNSTGYKGVMLRKDSGKYRAVISVNKRKINLGNFKTAIEAAMAYDKYIIENNLEHTRNFTD